MKRFVTNLKQKTFGQFIKQKRLDANLAQGQVAACLGYDSHAMISLLENRDEFWTLHHILLLADLFEMQPWELMREWMGQSPKRGLTTTDIAILRFAAQGMRNKEIAKALGKTERTVKNYFSILFKELGVRNRTEAVAVTYDKLGENNEKL